MADSMRKLAERYQKYVIDNPDTTSQVETLVRIASYLIAGRFEDATVLSELVYSASNLFVLLNDSILRRATNLYQKQTVPQQKLMTWLTVLEYGQVFLEMAVSHTFGPTARWIVVACIEIAKAAIRFLLLLKHKTGIIPNPPIHPLNRDDLPEDADKIKQVSGSQEEDKAGVPGLTDDTSSKGPVTFTLKSSGRKVRTLAAAPPSTFRTWDLPEETTPKKPKHIKEIVPTQLNRQRTIAEALHIARPLAHLISMYIFGKMAWKPLCVASAMDITSLFLMGDPKDLNSVEKAELHRRTVLLLYYMLRSPFYDQFTQTKILLLLKILSDNVPLTGIILRPLLQYLPTWQKVYFYVWAT